MKRNLYRKLSAPISVQIEITGSCNNNCVYCYNHWREKNQIFFKSLSAENLSRICDQLISSKVFTVTLTGGEPLLLWKQLSTVISRLESSNISVSVNSNLTIFTKEIAQTLKESGLKGILTSFLSHDEKIHDRLANRTGSWKQAVNGIEIAVANDFNISANMVLLKQNHEAIYETARFLKSIGVNSFSATKASPALNSRNFRDFMLDISELRESLNALESVKKELGMSVDVLECYPLCLLSDLNKFWNYGRRNCTAGATSCTIGSDGNIRPCSHSDMIYGNIFEENLPDIFNKMDDWREGKYIPNDCKECAHLKICSGGCRMEAKYFGNICGKDPHMTNPSDVISKSENDSKIEEISLSQKYSLKQNICFREEEFGAVVAAQGSETALINKDGFQMLKKAIGYSFSIKEMAKKINSKQESLRKFFAYLLKCRLIYPAEQI